MRKFPKYNEQQISELNDILLQYVDEVKRDLNRYVTLTYTQMKQVIMVLAEVKTDRIEDLKKECIFR